MKGLRQLENLINRLDELGALFPDEVEECRESFLDIEINLKKETEFIRYMREFNAITNKKYRPDAKLRELYYKSADFYSANDKLQALNNAITAVWFKDNPHMLNPEFLLKQDTISRYFNFKETKTITSQTVTNQETTDDYADI